MLPKQLFFTSQSLKSLCHQTQGSRAGTWAEGEREADSVSSGIRAEDKSSAEAGSDWYRTAFELMLN